MRFDFDFEGFLPRHLMTMFTVQRHEEIVEELVWQNGVRLRSDEYDTKAMAQADYHARRFSLWVSGGQTGRYFAVLRDEVLRILKRMEKLRYTQWLWLSDAARIEGEPVRLDGDEMPRAKYLQLLALESRGRDEYISEQNVVYSLSGLLNDLPREKPTAPDGPINIGKVEIVEKKIMGDFIRTGDINHANVNLKSVLKEVTQSVGSISDEGGIDKAALQAEINRLAVALELVKQELADPAQVMTTQVKNLVDEAAKPKPSLFNMEISRDGMKKAAEALRDVVPIAWEVAVKIAEILRVPFGS